MKIFLFAFCLAMLFGLMTYLKLSDANFRLMSLDGPVEQLNTLIDENLFSCGCTDLNFKNPQLEHEFKAIVGGISLGVCVWFVMMVLYRIQIFVVDFKDFLPLKK